MLSTLRTDQPREPTLSALAWLPQELHRELSESIIDLMKSNNAFKIRRILPYLVCYHAGDKINPEAPAVRRLSYYESQVQCSQTSSYIFQISYSQGAGARFCHSLNYVGADLWYISQYA